MSANKKLPPIQSAPYRAFTVRLVDGHFVRVPKVENIATTDATRPATIPHGVKLVNGHFVRASAADAAVSKAKPPAPAKPPAAPITQSWAVAFGTRLNSSDSRAES